MIWIAVVLGVFLFYKFVERRHKIIFFKVVGSIGVVGLVGVGLFQIYDNFIDVPPKREVKVRFIRHVPKISKENMIQVVDGIFKKSEDEWEAFRNLDKDQKNYLKNKLYDFVSYDYELTDFPEGPGDEEFSLSLDHLQNNYTSAEEMNSKEEKWIKLARERLDRILSNLEETRLKMESDSPVMVALKLNFVVESLEMLPDLDRKFREALTEKELKNLETFGKLRKREKNRLLNELSELDYPSEISFEVCNVSNQKLLSYWFYVSGTQEGRSTKFSVEKNNYGASEKRFDSDFIANPNDCNELTWSGNFKYFDSYEVSSSGGNWADN